MNRNAPAFPQGAMGDGDVGLTKGELELIIYRAAALLAFHSTHDAYAAAERWVVKTAKDLQGEAAAMEEIL